MFDLRDEKIVRSLSNPKKVGPVSRQKGRTGRRPLGGNADRLNTQDPGASRSTCRKAGGTEKREGNEKREMLFSSVQSGEYLRGRKSQESRGSRPDLIDRVATRGTASPVGLSH